MEELGALDMGTMPARGLRPYCLSSSIIPAMLGSPARAAKEAMLMEGGRLLMEGWRKLPGGTERSILTRLSE